MFCGLHFCNQSSFNLQGFIDAEQPWSKSVAFIEVDHVRARSLARSLIAVRSKLVNGLEELLKSMSRLQNGDLDAVVCVADANEIGKHMDLLQEIKRTVGSVVSNFSALHVLPCVKTLLLTDLKVFGCAYMYDAALPAGTLVDTGDIVMRKVTDDKAKELYSRTLSDLPYMHAAACKNATVDAGSAILRFFVLRDSHLISWKSTKQATVSLSTREAQYKALANACKDVIWIQSLSTKILPGCQESSDVVHIDSRGAIDLALSQVSQNGFRTKHMDLQLHFIRDLIASKLIKIIHVSGLKNFANFLTKPVGQTIIKRAISIFATSSPSISALCSQACGMLACQNADSVALHDPDVIMQSICEELRSDALVQGTAKDPSHHNGQCQAMQLVPL
ncbi:hypothetical protein PCANC_23082 [Puccinia coronata f. sp. avenae]|uniref:Uncharacterized protein n=1 Tax=Puccinia coronata f. sp. avenae TaxID=200324 RepID=A0A2N5U7G3_9BASI|nr:hypothetical protein PCANC_23082 [Puccinia coronata f. sp. avenae]